MVKFAIPVSNGQVCPHFGHCESFALFDIAEDSKIAAKNIVPSPGHEPGFLPQWLAQQGVNKVIAGGMGSRAQMLFQQNNIEVIVGAVESDPEKAVLRYLEGNLDTRENACDH